MRKRAMTLFFAGLALAAPLSAAERIKVGFISTLSGPPGAIGIEIREGFNLGLQQKLLN